MARKQRRVSVWAGSLLTGETCVWNGHCLLRTATEGRFVVLRPASGTNRRRGEFINLTNCTMVALQV